MKKINQEKFLMAAFNGHSTIINKMINNGANPNHSFRGNSILHWAAQEGRLGVVNILIKAGSNINSKNKIGETPIFSAIKHPKIIKSLIMAGAKVNIRRKDYPCTPLHLACAFGYYSSVKLLLKNGASTSAKDISNHTPLYYASKGKYKNIIKILKNEKTV